MSDGELELVAVTRQLEELLGRAARDVEEHGVGEGVVHDPQTTGEKCHGAPQQLGPCCVDLSERLIGNLDEYRRFEGLHLGAARGVVKKGHLANQIATRQKGQDRLSAIEGVAHDREATTLEYKETVGLVVLTKEGLAPSKVNFRGMGEKPVEQEPDFDSKNSPFASLRELGEDPAGKETMDKRYQTSVARSKEAKT